MPINGGATDCLGYDNGESVVRNVAQKRTLCGQIQKMVREVEWKTGFYRASRRHLSLRNVCGPSEGSLILWRANSETGRLAVHRLGRAGRSPDVLARAGGSANGADSTSVAARMRSGGAMSNLLLWREPGYDKSKRDRMPACDPEECDWMACNDIRTGSGRTVID